MRTATENEAGWHIQEQRLSIFNSEEKYSSEEIDFIKGDEFS